MNNTFCSKCHRIPSQCCCTPAKTLTDEEIEELAKQYKDVDYTLDDEEPFDVFDYSGFARAILKKASEK
jgi:hypothetical protein